jgi:hypothetical protein
VKLTLSPLAVLAIATLASARAECQQAAPPAIAPASPFRYDDDPTAYADKVADNPYSQLKYIPLGDSDYLSFGADLRERVEASGDALLGFRLPDADAYDLHRLLVFADVRAGEHLRAFLQLGDHEEIGRQPAALPTDVDVLDLSQAFIDASGHVAGGNADLRVGRAEMSFDDGALIGLRDGPNVRQVWDGVRLTFVDGPWRWDAFVVEPVSVRPGILDDGRMRGQPLDGVHLTVTPTSTLAADAFYYYNVNPEVGLYGAAGRERTETFGLRVRGSVKNVDGSVGAIGQTGDANGRDVRAFALHADLGVGLEQAPWSPHIGLRSDILSGGNPTAQHIATFNALYPNVAYSTEATIEAPANLVQVGVVSTVSPSSRITLQSTLEGLWRYSTMDAFYAAPLFPLVRPDGRHDAYTGMESQIEATWRVNGGVTVKAALVHFFAGDFIRRGGGSDETFGMTSISLRL